MQTGLRFIFILSMGLWIGSIFFFAFIAAPGIFKVLPRETAGNIVSEIFPKYYMIAYIFGALALLSTLLMWFYGFRHGTLHVLTVIFLVIMLGLAAFAGNVIRPQAVETRARMRSVGENAPEYRVLQKKFSALHTNSAMANGAILILGIAILFINAYTIRE